MVKVSHILEFEMSHTLVLDSILAGERGPQYVYIYLFIYSLGQDYVGDAYLLARDGAVSTRPDNTFSIS